MQSISDPLAQFPEEQADDGCFVRQPDEFRGWVKADGSTEYPVAAGRYHLYVSLAALSPVPHKTRSGWCARRTEGRSFSTKSAN